MIIVVSLLWRDHGALSAQANKGGVGALEDASIVVAAKVSPLSSGDVALLMCSLVAAVILVPKFIKDSSKIDVMELSCAEGEELVGLALGFNLTRFTRSHHYASVPTPASLLCGMNPIPS